MSWCDLLFAHWPVPPEALQPLLPPGLTLETFDGQAWLGLVPFRMVDVGPRGTPAPCRHHFPELNLRTYVRAGEMPGVWFFSLDATSSTAVLVGRRAYHVPYFRARMRAQAESGWIRFESRRAGDGPAAAFVGRYRPAGPVVLAAPGSLDHWLTERYCFYAAGRAGLLFRTQVHHTPWPLQPAEAELDCLDVITAAGVSVSGAPLLHFARRLDVVAWSPERLAATGTSS